MPRGGCGGLVLLHVTELDRGTSGWLIAACVTVECEYTTISKISDLLYKVICVVSTRVRFYK